MRAAQFIKGVAEAYQFKGSFPFDVDHMHGGRGINLPKAETKKYFTDKKQWQRAVDDINSSKYDDNSDYIGVTGRSTVEINGREWARWSDAQQKGYIELSSMSEQGVAEGSADTVMFEIDSENAYNHVMQQFGSVVEWNGDTMVAPRKYWGSIQELAYSAGGEATEVGNEQGVAEGNYDRDDYYNARQGREYGRDMTATGWGGDGSKTRRDDIFKGQSKRLPADPFARTSGAVPKTGTGRIHSNALPGEMDEGWKDKLAAAGLAGAMAMGSSGAQARVSGDQDPNINRFTGKPVATQQSTDIAPATAPSSQSFSKEYLQRAADPNRTGRYMISVEKAQELLSNMKEGTDNEKIGGRYDADEFDSMVSRLKKLAGASPMRTVYDPDRRVYRNMPSAQQPAQQPKKAPR
jgi:hypothetical protein